VDAREALAGVVRWGAISGRCLGWAAAEVWELSAFGSGSRLVEVEVARG
jgi:hypothetical protein